MQCKSYFAGYHSTRDLNVDAHVSKWPLYIVNKTFESGNSYNISLSPPAPDLHLVCDKEVLKQTMLKHEVMFKEQVHELHRLYNRQRELMDEIRSKELHGHHMRVETSQSNLFLYQNSSEYSQKMLPVPSFPGVDPSCSRPSTSGARNFHPPLSMQGGGSDFGQTEGSCKDSELLASKCKKFQNKILDLQLPATEYVDSEEELFEEEKVSDVLEVSSYPPKKVPEVMPKTDVNLFDHCGRLSSVGQGDGPTPNSFSKRSTCLVDLNEPFQFQEATSSSSVDFPGPILSYQEIPHHDLSGKISTDFQNLSKDNLLFTQTTSDLEACSNFVDMVKERERKWPNFVDTEKERERKWLSCNDEGKGNSNLISFGQGIYPEKSSLTKPLQVELKKVHELETSTLLDKINKKTCSQRSSSGLEAASCVQTSCQLVPQSNMAKSESSSVSSWRKSAHDWNRNPIAVQALPCFNAPALLRKNSKSSIGSSGLSGNKIQLSESSRCNQSSTSASSLRNIAHNESQLDLKTFGSCTPSHRLDDLKCNNDSDSSSRHDLRKWSKGLEFMDVKFARNTNLNAIKHPDCSTVVSISHTDTVNLDREKKLHSSSAVLTWLKPKSCDDESDLPSHKKILGFSVSHQPPISRDQFSSLASFNCRLDSSEIDDTKTLENIGNESFLVRDTTVKKHSCSGNNIDLNSCINIDESSAEIDLEAPESPENEECSPPRGKFVENQLETPLLDNGDGHEDLVKFAAEAIISISSGFQVCLESTDCESSESSSCNDSLKWFAGVVSSLEGNNLKKECEVVSSGKDDNDIDYFEAMTLKLPEVRVEEEYLYKSNYQTTEQTDVPLLTRRPRKGRTRRGRKWKDFQSEVLPCLASLSRNEVTEDLQIIEGLMESAGTPQKTSLSRKNASRSRRRRCNMEERPTNLCSSLLKKQTNVGELGFGGCVIGWGKIPRRRRGVRCPASNISLILGQVS